MRGVAQTLIVTVWLSAVPQRPLTRTQYVVVSCGVTGTDAAFPPLTGAVVTPRGLVYHWYVRFVPVALRVSVEDVPRPMFNSVAEAQAIAGGWQMVIRATLLVTLPQRPVT